MPHHWNEIANLRRQQIEGGRDLTFSVVFLPYYQRLFSVLNPMTVLEVGGGTGHLARVLSPGRAKYVMIEPSLGMYDVAREVLDGTQVEVYNSTVESFPDSGKFDLVLSHMCLQAVGNIRAFLGALSERVAHQGSFFVTLPHPAFYNDYKKFFSSFQYMKEQHKTVSFTITLEPSQPIDGIPYYHRPLSTYISALSAAGLCLTHLEEIYPESHVQRLYGAPWNHPRYLVLGGCHAPWWAA